MPRIPKDEFILSETWIAACRCDPRPSALKGTGRHRGISQQRDLRRTRANLLTLKPQGKRCALRVIAALDRLQREFEGEIGKSALGEMLKSLRKLEARASDRFSGPGHLRSR
jgi:hypothetical protein